MEYNLTVGKNSCEYKLDKFYMKIIYAYVYADIHVNSSSAVNEVPYFILLSIQNNQKSKMNLLNLI